MKLLLTSVGSRGDVQPLLGLATGLRTAGHEVLIAAPPNFGEWVTQLGFRFHPCGFDILSWAQARPDFAKSPLYAARVMSAKLREEVPIQFKDMADVVEGMDAVVSTGLQVAASSLAEKWGIPYHFAPFVPGMLYSPSHPPAVVAWFDTPRFVNRLGWWAFHGTYNWLLKPGVNAGRAKLGLPPIDSFGELFVGRDVLLAVDPELSVMPADVDTPYTMTGAWTLPADEPLPPDLEQFLDSGPPPYFIGFGSVPDGTPDETTRLLVDSIRAVGGRGLISRGWANLARAPLPEGFHAVDNVSHELLFPRVAAVIHHGGAGTTQTAARAGVPQLIMAHGADQFYWAHRIETLGLGPPGLPKTRLRKDRLTAALRLLADNVSYRERAAALGARLRQVDGVGNAVRYLESRHARRAA